MIVIIIISQFQSKLINIFHFKIFKQAVQTACSLIFVYLPSQTANALLESTFKRLSKSYLKNYQLQTNCRSRKCMQLMYLRLLHGLLWLYSMFSFAGAVVFTYNLFSFKKKGNTDNTSYMVSLATIRGCLSGHFLDFGGHRHMSLGMNCMRLKCIHHMNAIFDQTTGLKKIKMKFTTAILGIWYSLQF